MYEEFVQCSIKERKRGRELFGYIYRGTLETDRLIEESNASATKCSLYQSIQLLTWLATYETVALITIRTAAIGHVIRVNADSILGTRIMHITRMYATLIDARLSDTTVRVVRALNWGGGKRETALDSIVTLNYCKAFHQI